MQFAILFIYYSIPFLDEKTQKVLQQTHFGYIYALDLKILFNYSEIGTTSV
jgi:hypothetical protein